MPELLWSLYEFISQYSRLEEKSVNVLQSGEGHQSLHQSVSTSNKILALYFTGWHSNSCSDRILADNIIMRSYRDYLDTSYLNQISTII